MKLVCIPEEQFLPFKHTPNECFKPSVLQLLEGKGVQHGGYPLELHSKACCVFGAGLAASLAHQTVLMQAQHPAETLALHTSKLGIFKRLWPSFEGEFGILQRKPEANQEAFYWESQW